ncbi:MAG: hypothetical protein ACI4IF_05820 [Acutalibacteraceae bacterium]
MNKEFIASKKEYITPDFDIMFFDIDSIITTSSGGGSWEEDEYETGY